MLGWWFLVTHQTPKDWALMPDREQYRIASWETGTDGIRWIEALALQGLAEKQSGHGYPSRYLVKAQHVLPMIREGATPDWAFNNKHRWKNGYFHHQNIASCADEQMLNIDVWDQS